MYDLNSVDSRYQLSLSRACTALRVSVSHAAPPLAVGHWELAGDTAETHDVPNNKT